MSGRSKLWVRSRGDRRLIDIDSIVVVIGKELNIICVLDALKKRQLICIL